ncbi:MAG: hypothetical protein RLZZ126_186 [Pseudomonadota bacterium]|jgi:redox-sensitive bicupin YhaK (pirin superfamily)
MSVILQAQALGNPPWPTLDPFLFCAYHDDLYPRGKADLTPDASLAGRQMGSDFAGVDGWRMYHGETVPGFPSHPHRGFETVTIVRKGLIDHSDSLGATARFGVAPGTPPTTAGDVQWLTAGRGIVHAEMFPLLNSADRNPLELFQIWLNLPASHKMAAPYFTMFWADTIPRLQLTDRLGLQSEVALIAGAFGSQASDKTIPTPPPDSWAAQAQADVAIWTIRMPPHAVLSLPGAGPGSRRMLYFFKGQHVTVGAEGSEGQKAAQHCALELRAQNAVTLTNGPTESEFLLLQGRPIAEPVAQYGPFVMNTQAEIHQAFADYRRTQFGGWPFAAPDPVHGHEPRRFARHADGRLETVA